MTTKIKVFFVFLAVMAIVSVSSFFDVLSGVRAIFDEPSEPLPPIATDTDQDGLPDSEESYWGTDFLNPDSDGDGFLDGEEVASRRDPTIPAPNDAIADTNMTQKVANLALGGLVEGSLKYSSDGFDNSVESLTLSVMDEGLASFISQIEPGQIKTSESTENNQEKYKEQISIVLEKFIKALYAEAENFDSKLNLLSKGGLSNQEFISYFSLQGEVFDLLAKDGLKISVPENMSVNHISFIDYIMQFSEINKALAQGQDDPVRAAMGLNLFISLIETFPETMESFYRNLE